MIDLVENNWNWMEHLNNGIQDWILKGTLGLS